MKNRLLQQFLIPLIALISLIYAIQALGKQSDNILSEVHYHQNGTKKGLYLETGNFILYFTKKPVVNLLKTDQKDAYEEQTFFFPNVMLKGKELEAAIEEMSREYGNCTIHVVLVKKPMPGVQISIRYDRNKIALAYEEFESISLKNGVEFRLYNKEVIEKLRSNKNKPVLITASTGYKPWTVAGGYMNKYTL